jgi:membrane associated rhomboid family serine protease
MAISAAAMMLFPLDRVYYRFVLLPLPLAVGMYIGSDLLGVTLRDNAAGGVDHMGHLGGAMMGMCVCVCV